MKEFIDILNWGSILEYYKSLNIFIVMVRASHTLSHLFDRNRRSIYNV